MTPTAIIDQNLARMKAQGASKAEMQEYFDFERNRGSFDAKQAKAPFKAKHPNVYGALGATKETVKALVPYTKYIDPEERERFMKLSKQHQVRDLLLQNLEVVSEFGIAPIAKGVSPVLKSLFPKTFKKLAKAMPPKAPEMPQDPIVAKVTSALKEAKPIRKKQELIYSQERGIRIENAIEVGRKTPGESGYYAQLKELKGEMPKVEFENIRNKIGQKDIDSLFDRIRGSSLDEWDKLPAQKGLAKLFGEFGGKVPTENELSLLEDVFGGNFVKAAKKKKDLFTKAKEAGIQIANIPRSIMASYDLSAPFRQGVFLVGRPKGFAAATKEMFKSFGSEKAYVNLLKGIKQRPSYKTMKESGLSLTEVGTKLSAREEAFMSNWAEKIPIIGRGVKMSARAHTGFLNKLRADVFDDIVKKGTSLGITDPKFLKDTAKFVNAATGRGGLGSLEKVAVPLNTVFFSPRLVSSRLSLVNPAFYAKLHPQARKEALKSLFTFAGTASTIAGLAKMGGADVGVDPRNADFMKIKTGNTRYDILGGFQQPIRLAAQLISGEVVSSTTGKIITLGEGYKPLTRTEIATRFLEYKTSPIASFAIALARGQTAMGEKVDIPTEVMNRFVPMVMQDMADLYKEKGLEGIGMGSPAMFGVGVQTYGGVSSYGLDGKDYPNLNKELTRLNTSMGYPSTSAFGEELTNKEFQALKNVSGTAIAKTLGNIIETQEYEQMPDLLKVKTIETVVDKTKNRVKEKMFRPKQIKSKLKSKIKKRTALRDDDAKKLAERILGNR